jgi:hypothetical protein
MALLCSLLRWAWLKATRTFTEAVIEVDGTDRRAHPPA